MRPLLLATAAACAAAARVPGSPYPVASLGLNCTTMLFSFNPANATKDDQYTAQIAQGIMAKNCPRVIRADPSSAYALWLNQTVQTFGTLVNAAYETNVQGILSTFVASFSGYTLVDFADNSTALGVAVASAIRAVAVTPANEAKAIAAGLQKLYDLRGRDLKWVLATFNGTAASNGFVFSPTVSILQSPQKPQNMGDYAIAAGALQWWSDAPQSDPLAASILGSMTAPFSVLGWGPDELNTVFDISAYGGVMVASDWGSNVDFLSGFDIPQFTQKPAPQTASVVAAASSSKPGVKAAGANKVHTVCFLMSDGDNLQWLLDNFATGADWWASPDRGKVAMGWTLSPSAADLAPAVMQYLYNTALNDHFVAGVSGAGYFYPDKMSPSALSAVTSLTNAYMAKAGMRIVNVMNYGNTYTPQQMAAYTSQPGIDAVMMYYFSNYAGGVGAIDWSNGKPVIGGRFALWGDGTNPSGPTWLNVTGAINTLLTQARDPTSAAGYSLIPVHAWSHNVTDVRTIRDALDAAAPGQFEVVTPDEFVARILANVVH